MKTTQKAHRVAVTTYDTGHSVVAESSHDGAAYNVVDKSGEIVSTWTMLRRIAERDAVRNVTARTGAAPVVMVRDGVDVWRDHASEYAQRVLHGYAVMSIWQGMPDIDPDSVGALDAIADTLRDYRRDHPEWKEVAGRNTRNDARAMIVSARHDRFRAVHASEGTNMQEDTNATPAPDRDPALSGVTHAVAAIVWEDIAPERRGELDTSQNGVVLEIITRMLRERLPEGADLRIVCGARDYITRDHGVTVSDPDDEIAALDAWREIVAEVVQAATDDAGIEWSDPWDISGAEPYGMVNDPAEIVATSHGYPIAYYTMRPATDDRTMWETSGDVLCADCARDAVGDDPDVSLMPEVTDCYEYGEHYCSGCGCDITGGDPDIPERIEYRYNGAPYPGYVESVTSAASDAIVWRCDRGVMPSARDLWDAIADTPRRETVDVYAGIAMQDGKPAAERLQVVYWPARGRIGIAWGADAAFADVNKRGTDVATVCEMVSIYLTDGETFAAMN